MIFSFISLCARLLPFAPDNVPQLGRHGAAVTFSDPTKREPMILADTAGSRAVAMVTPNLGLPRRVKRVVDLSFIGYVTVSGQNEYTGRVCVAPKTWTVYNNYGVCVSGIGLPWTGCIGASTIVNSNTEAPCGAGDTCFIQPVYPSFGAANFVTYVACNTEQRTYYVASPIQSPGPSPAAGTSPSSSPITVSATITNTASPLPGTGSPTTISPLPAKSNSTPAIVGGTVGGVVFLGVAALIGLFMCLRHRTARDDSGPNPNHPPGPQQLAEPALAADFFSSDTRENPSRNSPAELSAAQYAPQPNYHQPGIDGFPGTAAPPQPYYPPPQELPITAATPQPYYPPPGPH